MTGNTNTARLKRLGLAAAASVGLLALVPASAIAAPIGGVGEVRIPSAVTQAAYQCWYADGGHHCANLNVPAGPPEYGYYRHRHYHDYYRPYYGYHYRRLKRPEHYWTGSRRWWSSMEFWGRSGTD